MLVRALPLQAPGGEHGALVLVRDVTDVRRRDRALMTKDATIREIHHRVKNNLQTVAALLRLQARRVDRARRARRAAGGRPPGGVDRRRARDPGGQPGGRRRRRRGARPGAADAGRRGLRRATGGDPRRERPVRRAARGQRDPAGAGGDRAAAQRRRARLRRRPGRQHRARSPSATATTWSSGSPTTDAACRRGSTPRPAGGWACRSCRRWSPASCTAGCEISAPPEGAGHLVVLALPGAGRARR